MFGHHSLSVPVKTKGEDSDDWLVACNGKAWKIRLACLEWARWDLMIGWMTRFS
jgi:hypothetical protein